MTWCALFDRDPRSQASLNAFWSAFRLENPKAEAAVSKLPNCWTRADSLRPLQFPCPGVPAFGTVSPVNENVALNVRTGLPAEMMSVPMRSQSGFRPALRTHDCKSPA